MSLINDALKKAQRQRTGDSPASQPPIASSIAPTRPARASDGLSPQLLLVGAGTLLGVVIAVGAIFFFRSKPAAETAPPATQVAAAPAEKSPAVATTPAPQPSVETRAPTSAPAASSVSSEPTVVVKTAPPAATTPSAANASNNPTRAAASVSLPVVAEKTAPVSEPSVASAPPVPSLRMIEAIEALHVAGIRVGTGTDAKVLMNDRVYRVGDTVDHALGIKLSGVAASALTFRDASGATYTRNF